MSTRVQIIAALLAITLPSVTLFWWLRPGSAEVRVSIPQGLTASETGRLLKREGVIHSVTLFKLFVRLSGKERSLKPGEYVFRKPISSPQALLQLYRGNPENIKVVVPEGFMAKQIADRLEASGITESAAFMTYVRSKSLEGFLFPTTYHFSKGLPHDKVAQHMVQEFRRSVEPAFKKADQKRFTLKQLVTLASIVQREAAVIDEMPMIAAVYLNRLDIRKKLEADPTVQYAMGRDTGHWFKNLRHKHLKISSPYNTYRNYGLPPGPICSPGLDAMKAVLSPARTKAIYFVADNTGRHTFSRTLAEHLKATEKAKRERNRMRWRKKK